MVLVREIKNGQRDIAHVYDLSGAAGSSFPTPPTFPLQFGVGHASALRVVPSHVHIPCQRTLTETAEFIFVMDGQMDVVFLDDDGAVIGEHSFTPQMAFLQVSGGHTITFHAGTRYFELKQGPYLGRDADKRDVEAKS
jgi:hypothetical protein